MNFDNKLSVEDQLLLALDLVLTKGKKCSFGDLVRGTFIKFPKTFALSKYPNWPDSLKLDRPIRKLRERGFITGSPVTYFSLTKLGELRIRELNKNGRTLSPKKVTRDPDRFLLSEIESSNAFKLFKEKEHSLSNMQVRELTKTTLETPKERVLHQIEYLKQRSRELKNHDLEDFLTLCKRIIQEKR